MPNGRARGAFDVLVVEDDAATRDEYAEFLTTLGYPCLLAADGSEALKAIAASPTIGIVLTDLNMPTMDGLSLLGEMQARFTPFRPLVPVVVTGMVNLETAVQVMRSDAIDFLPKPVVPALFTAALRRAAARWTLLDGQFRLMALLEQNNGSLSKSFAAQTNQPVFRTPDREELQKFARTILKARQQRHEFLDTSLFADPAWDIMLDLTSAALEGRSVPLLSASAAANVPMTTALRYLKRLAEDGVVKRWDDPDDKRRSLVALEDSALESMILYLTSFWHSMASDGLKT